MMNRLTKKAQFVRNLITGKEMKYISNESDQMCVDKLGKLEDIEEELGIDLITLFDIDKQLNTKKEIWFKIEDEIEENLRFDSYYIIDLKHKAFVKIEYEPLDYLYFKDYGKTWALTKEELEDDKQSTNIN